MDQSYFHQVGEPTALSEKLIPTGGILRCLVNKYALQRPLID